MQIVKVEYDNWKGVTDSFELGKINLVTGPNGSGKSARLSGLQFALNGSIPTSDRTSDAYKYIGTDKKQASVTAVLDCGHTWQRTVKLTSTGTVSQAITVNGNKLKIADAESQLSSKVGEFAYTFSVAKFCQLSPEKKRNLIVQLTSSTDSVDDGEISVAVLSQILGEAAVRLNPDPTVLKTLLPETQQVAFNKVISESCTIATQGRRIDVLSKELESVKKCLNDARANLRQHHATTQKFAELQVEPASASDTQTIATRIRELRAQKEDLVKQLQYQSGRSVALESTQQQLDAAIQRSNDLHNQRKTCLHELEQAEKALAEELTKTEHAKKFYDEKQQQHLKCLNDKTTSRDDAAEAERMAIKAAEEFTNAVQASDNRKASLEYQILEELTRLEEEHYDLIGGKTPIPMVHSLLAKRYPVISEDRIDFLREDVANAATQHHTFAQRRDDALKAERECAEQLERLRQKLESAESAFTEAEKMEAMCEHNLVMTDRSIQDNERSIKQNREALDKLKQNVQDVPENQLEEQIANLNDLLDASEREVSQRRTWDIWQREQAKLEGVAEEIQAEIDVASAAVKAIQQLRDDCVRKVIAPLCKHIDDFIAAPYPECHSFCQLENTKGKAIFELGWHSPEGKFSMDTLSGGETTVFCAALAYALLQLANPPLKILSLEAAEIDCEHFDKLLAGLNATQGNYSNAIVATHQSVSATSEIKHVPLGEEVALAK